MAVSDPLSDLLACPRCDRSPLTHGGAGHLCGGCKTVFPRVGRIPWLFADPDASLDAWRNRLHFELRHLAHESGRLEGALRKPDLMPLTRSRLERQIAATGHHRDALRSLLAPVDVQTCEATYESHLALRTRLPIDQALGTYYANVHRDWAWGDEENAASLAAVRGVLESGGDPGAAIGDTLVLGAGASRLAYDLHMVLAATRTVALDFNPLLLLIADIVASGQSLELYEFPTAPRSLDDFAVARTLRAPRPVRDGFHLILADVLRPPFRRGVFDTVVTPWLIDIVTEDLPVFAARIGGLLKTGGRWVNFGSLAFDHPDRERRYSTEETLAILGEAGFVRPEVREDILPYMCSPASRHGRREQVFTFAAARENEATASPRHRALPDWLVLGNEPVPLLPSFRTQATSTQIYSFIMSLVDGRRSIADMAAVLEQHKLMTRREAEPAIRNFLTRMYDDSQRRSEF